MRIKACEQFRGLLRLRLLLFLAALGYCNYAIGQDVDDLTPLQRLCVVAGATIADAIDRGDFDVPFTMIEDTSVPDARYWYGEWFGHLIPVPTVDVEPSVTEGFAATVLGVNADYQIAGSQSGVWIWASGFDAVVSEYGLTPSPVPDLAALRAGFVGDPSDVECDEENPDATLRRLDELYLRTGLMVGSSADHIYFLGDSAVLTYKQRGEQGMWHYHFAVDAERSPLAKITILADKTMYPKAGFRVVRSAGAYSYANAEPDWLQGLFSESEMAFSKVLGLTPR